MLVKYYYYHHCVECRVLDRCDVNTVVCPSLSSLLPPLPTNAVLPRKFSGKLRQVRSHSSDYKRCLSHSEGI